MPAVQTPSALPRKVVPALPEKVVPALPEKVVPALPEKVVPALPAKVVVPPLPEKVVAEPAPPLPRCLPVESVEQEATPPVRPPSPAAPLLSPWHPSTPQLHLPPQCHQQSASPQEQPFASRPNQHHCRRWCPGNLRPPPQVTARKSSRTNVVAKPTPQEVDTSDVQAVDAAPLSLENVPGHAAGETLRTSSQGDAPPPAVSGRKLGSRTVVPRPRKPSVSARMLRPSRSWISRHPADHGFSRHPGKR